MSLVGSPDWQRGVSSTTRPMYVVKQSDGADTLMTTGGNGIAIWNVDIVPESSCVGSLSVAPIDPAYYLGASNGPAPDHWASSRGLYITAGIEIQIIVQGSFSGIAFIGMLYDQL